MILLLRKIRKQLLEENRTTKYLTYAAGEIVLIVIGILIALQISNWNEERQDKASLEGYLTSIARNIESDLIKIESLRNYRQNIFSRVPYLTNSSYFDDYLSIEEILLMSETVSNLIDIKYLLPDLSGYESLKNSGYLNRLQGTDLELLLYQYYSLIKEINNNEQSYNQVLLDAARDYRQADLQGSFMFARPKFIRPDEVSEIQERMFEIVRNKSVQQLFTQSEMNASLLISKYDNLAIIGEQLKRLIDNKKKSFDAVARDALSNVYDINGKLGYPKIMADGVENVPLFAPGYAQSEPSGVWAYSLLGELLIKFNGMAWGVQYATVATDALNERPGKDYSAYRTLRIEAKASEVGETILVIVKDAEDPDDGSETRVPVKLSTEWQFYDIPLSEFKNADLTNIYMPYGIVFGERAQTVSIRTIEYLK